MTIISNQSHDSHRSHTCCLGLSQKSVLRKYKRNNRKQITNNPGTNRWTDVKPTQPINYISTQVNKIESRRGRKLARNRTKEEEDSGNYKIKHV